MIEKSRQDQISKRKHLFLSTFFHPFFVIRVRTETFSRQPRKGNAFMKKNDPGKNDARDDDYPAGMNIPCRSCKWDRPRGKPAGCEDSAGVEYFQGALERKGVRCRQMCLKLENDILKSLKSRALEPLELSDYDEKWLKRFKKELPRLKELRYYKEGKMKRMAYLDPELIDKLDTEGYVKRKF